MIVTSKVRATRPITSAVLVKEQKLKTREKEGNINSDPTH